MVPAVVNTTPVAPPFKVTANSDVPPAGVEDWILTDVGVLVSVCVTVIAVPEATFSSTEAVPVVADQTGAAPDEMKITACLTE